jgi:hypothetical protein
VLGFLSLVRWFGGLFVGSGKLFVGSGCPYTGAVYRKDDCDGRRDVHCSRKRGNLGLSLEECAGMLGRSAVSLYTGAVYDPLSGRVEHGRSTIGTEGRNRREEQKGEMKGWSGREERWGARKMARNSENNTEYS